MPIKVTNPTVTGAVEYGSPFVGPANHPAQISVDMTALTSAEIDTYGFIKPGVPLRSTGALISGASQVVLGVIPEALKVAAGNAAGDISAAGTQQITVMTIGQVNKAVIEANLGRVLSANEIAGFAAGGLILL